MGDYYDDDDRAFIGYGDGYDDNNYDDFGGSDEEIGGEYGFEEFDQDDGFEDTAKDNLKDDQQFQSTYSDMSRISGDITGDRRIDMYNSQLKKSLQNRGVERYYEAVLGLDTYWKLNTDLLGDVLRVFDEYSGEKIPDSQMSKIIRGYVDRQGITYTAGDFYRYWRYIKDRFRE